MRIVAQLPYACIMLPLMIGKVDFPVDGLVFRGKIIPELESRTVQLMDDNIDIVYMTESQNLQMTRPNSNSVHPIEVFLPIAVHERTEHIGILAHMFYTRLSIYTMLTSSTFQLIPECAEEAVPVS